MGIDEVGPEWFSHSIHPLHTTITRIRFPNEEGHATGFYYNFEEETYLITNRHVIAPQEGSSPDSMRIFTRSHPVPIEREFHDIDVAEGEGEDWYGHESEFDIAAVPLDFNLDSINPRIGIEDDRDPETGSLAFNKESILSEKDRVLAGDRAQIVGYPGQYVDKDFDFPVMRDAIISTNYGLPYNGTPMFLTDARMHPGMSGSPVVAGPVTLITYGGIDLWGPAYKLLGIHSSTLKQPVQEGENERMWLDLNSAWYAELIEEILLASDN
ncbi:S1 family peptidase [Halolamina rubra]|uniref:S1 family peptidase n=1 Tax=Halolamina rubra TaxID=1380430 RepID=UPI0009E505C3|nr:serine protease [Halolamina rubra]